MLPIKESYIPKGNKNRPALKLVPKYITLHTTRNLSKGADAEMHSKFVNNGGGSAGVSWHLTVDEDSIVQHLPFDENGWHGGDGYYGTGNRQSIGIEICENVDGDFDKAVKNAIELVAWLMNKFNIPLEKVVPHRHWSGKLCPRMLLDRWDEIQDRIEKELEPKVKSVIIRNPNPQPAPSGGTHNIAKGDTLWALAKKYNTTVEKLKQANPSIDIDNLQIGQVINLSPERRETYTIKKGDTLWEIAESMKGLTVGDLIKANPSVDVKNLQVGQVINIIRFDDPKPVEKKPEPVKPAPKPQPKPQPKKEYVVLPAYSDSWRVYPTNKAPVKGNEKGYLNPKKFNGLTYEVLGHPQANIVTIQSASFGKVNIFVAPLTGAKFTWK